MKKNQWIIYIASLLLTWSCTDEDIISKYSEIAVTASVHSSRTTYKSENGVTKVSWSNGDRIGLYAKNQVLEEYLASSSGPETTFQARYRKLQANEGDSVYAYYPFNPFSVLEDNKVLLPISSNLQAELSSHDFMYAASCVKNSRLNFQFEHLFSFLKIIIPKENLQELEISGDGMTITSSSMISYEGHPYFLLDKKVVEGTPTNMISLYSSNLDVENDLSCYIAMLPQPEGTFIEISSGDEVLYDNYVPEGGFKAGHVYTLNLDSKTFEEEALEEKAIEAREREALIAFYKLAGGDQWENHDNWCTDKPLSEWYGISVGEGKLEGAGRVPRVNGVSIDCNHISGDLPSCIEALLPLDNLENLTLLGGTMTGEIPETIGKFKELKMLTLVGLGVSGQLPESMGELSNLWFLNLSNNNLSGDLSSLQPIWHNLESLDLSYNSFSGELPELPDKIFGFRVNNNLFTGKIPESHIKVFEWKSYGIDYFIDGNNLSGKIPESMQNHKNWFLHWQRILPQNPGYGFERVDIPAHTNVVKCYDGTYLNLGEEYARNNYTIIFRWDPYCPFSPPYVNPIHQLYQKYKDKGLGLVCTTLCKYSMSEMEPLTSVMQNVKTFWEVMAGQGSADMSYDNNPYSIFGFFLFQFGVTPYFQVVDNNGKIIFFGSLGDIGTLSQHHANRDDIFDFVANLFGDETFEPENYTSTDYSRDGEVVTLQTATAGQGVNLIFMGEAFVDKDMESGGLYEQKMKEAMEKFFSIEPYKSMRNRFNVYAVKVVSPNEYFGASSKHRINEDNDICFEYAMKIPGADQQPLRVSVIYNTSGYVGRSYTAMYSDGSFVGYMMEGINDVLLHEAGGHGFANLMDEYVESGNENLTLPETDKNYMDELWSSMQGGANVDWRNDKATVKWAHFLSDDRYANEGLGLYEGAFLYGYGAYRPTENSMMRYNDSPFNAPSREQIYKRIMQYSEGETWQYDYEEFVEYDEINRNASSRSVIKPLTRKEQKEYIKNHRPPRFIKGTWRDAMKNGRSKVVVPLR